MEDSFKLLEERVKKAVARLRELRSENDVLRGELKAAAARAQKAEDAARSAQARVEKVEREHQVAAARAGEQAGGQAELAGRLEVAEREAADLRQRQEELRQRMVSLLEVLEKLD
jgi:chromosome segregation ATPase